MCLNECLLGMDLGTSSVKTALVTVSGRVVASGSAEYPILRPQPGYAEQDPQAWWRAVCEAVQAALQGVDGAVEVAAIGLSGQMHGTVLAGTDGQSLAPAIIWPDQRSAGAGDSDHGATRTGTADCHHRQSGRHRFPGGDAAVGAAATARRMAEDAQGVAAQGLRALAHDGRIRHGPQRRLRRIAAGRASTRVVGGDLVAAAPGRGAPSGRAGFERGRGRSQRTGRGRDGP